MPSGARTATQQQRRDETRRALLDAAVESLIEVGFARTTTLEVQRRADASRGALLHHFPSKTELLVAAVDHLAEMRARELKVLAAQLPRRPRAHRCRARAAVAVLLRHVLPGRDGAPHRGAHRSRAARRCSSPPSARCAIASSRRRARCSARTSREHPGLERALDLTLQFMIGAAMTAVLHKDDSRLRD